MATTTEVLRYINSRSEGAIGETGVHALVYYAQAWSLAWDGAPLFDDQIEASRDGPVLPVLRSDTDAAASMPAVPDEAARATVDAVLDFYGQHAEAAPRSTAPHEGPWADALAAGSRTPSSGNHVITHVITHEAMRRYYTEVALSDAAEPQRRSVALEASDDDVLEIARADAKRWSETLDILSR